MSNINNNTGLLSCVNKRTLRGALAIQYNTYSLENCKKFCPLVVENEYFDWPLAFFNNEDFDELTYGEMIVAEAIDGEVKYFLLTDDEFNEQYKIDQ